MLRNPNIKLPRMGLGCLELTRANNAIIDDSIQKGLLFFDTADCYGNNESEIALGEKLQFYDRNQLIVCTKGSLRFTKNGISVDGSKDYIRSACTASLQRLKTTYIDVYYLHRSDPKLPIEESITALSELVAEGKIRHIGLSEVTANQIRRAHPIHPISAVQIEYSPWARQDETNDVIATCRELDIQLVAYSPLGRAFFTQNPCAYFEALPPHDYRRLLPRYDSENLPLNIKLRDKFQKFADRKGCSLSQLVLAWELSKGMVVIPATTNRSHLDENLQALNIHLTQQEIAQIDSLINTVNFYGPRYPSAEVSAIYPEFTADNISLSPIAKQASSSAKAAKREVIPDISKSRLFTPKPAVATKGLPLLPDNVLRNDYHH